MPESTSKSWRVALLGALFLLGVVVDVVGGEVDALSVRLEEFRGRLRLFERYGAGQLVEREEAVYEALRRRFESLRLLHTVVEECLARIIDVLARYEAGGSRDG